MTNLTRIFSDTKDLKKEKNELIEKEAALAKTFAY